MTEISGRTCPIRYRYSPSAIGTSLIEDCETLYVVGGLYGNPFALRKIEQMFLSESAPRRLCFNGDFNWFNKSDLDFIQINNTVFKYDCTQGNVEAELSQPLEQTDCGCAYPDDVDQGTVDRSNTIHTELKQTAHKHADILSQLILQPFYRRYRISDLKVAVVHGDAESLAGWRFDPVNLRNTDETAWRQVCFEEADVDVFASSHTCSAAFHEEILASKQIGIISNNGAAGMPSVPGTHFGLLTRISVTPSKFPVHQSRKLKDVWVEQIKIDYDTDEWIAHFQQEWPEGSAAYQSYFKRIAQKIEQA